MKLPESEAAEPTLSPDQPPVWAMSDPDDRGPSPHAGWHRLTGGRINDVWQTGQRVLKVYRDNGASSLFPNDPVAEARALRHLAPMQITPRLYHLTARPGRAALVIEAANYGQPGPAEMGHLLARLHALPPVGQMRIATTSPEEIRAEVAAFRAELGDLAPLLPPEPAGSAAPPPRSLSLLHGDPVPANFVSDRRGAKLIDWSAAALGDPAHDLALALSPAMFALYGRGDHTAHASALLNAYGRSDSYSVLAPWLHWRIAAYCLWRAAQGVPGYHDAAQLEADFLAALVS
jgi:thiamine kinase